MEIHSLNSKTPSATDVLALDTGSDTYKATGTAVVENAAPTYTSGDAASPTSWADVTVLSSGLSVKTLLNRISTMIKNVRWLYSKLGTTELGTTATTITGAIAEHEADISGLNSNIAYKQGDAISFSGLKVFGRTVNAGDRVYMCINLPKPVSANGFSLTITAANAFVVSGSFGVGALTDIQHKGLQGPCGQVTFSLPLASSTTGGTPCCLEITGQLVFS